MSLLEKAKKLVDQVEKCNYVEKDTGFEQSLKMNNAYVELKEQIEDDEDFPHETTKDLINDKLSEIVVFLDNSSDGRRNEELLSSLDLKDSTADDTAIVDCDNMEIIHVSLSDICDAVISKVIDAIETFKEK